MISLIIPEYEEANLRFIMDVMQGFMRVDPLFSKLEFVYSEHKGPVRNIAGDSPVDQGMFSVTGEAFISKESVRDGIIEEYTSFLFNISESQRKSLARGFFSNISQICDATGNSINAQKQPLSAEMIIELIEKIEFDFDDDGNPRFPTLVMPPAVIEQLKSLSFTPEQDIRWKKIIEEKRARFNDNQRTRRLFK